MAFNNFPYTDLYNLNLDWILQELKNFNVEVGRAVTTANEAKTIANGYQAQIAEASSNANAAVTEANEAKGIAQNADNVVIVFVDSSGKAVNYAEWAAGSPDTYGANEIFTDLTVNHKIPFFMDRQQNIYCLAGYESSGLTVTRFKFSRYGGNGRENIAWVNGTANVEYTYIDGGTGGGAFTVTITRAQATGNITSDKTYTEVETAYNNGLAVICHVVDEINHLDYYTAKCEITTAANYGVFHWESLLFYDPSRIYTAFLRADGLTGIYVSYVLPAVSSNDNGKFLRVVDGVWKAASVPNAETTEFGP